MHRFGMKSGLKRIVDKNSLQINLLDIAAHMPRFILVAVSQLIL